MLSLISKVKQLLSKKKKLPPKDEKLIGDIRKLHEKVIIKKIVGNVVKGTNLEGTLSFEATICAQPKSFSYIKTRLSQIKIFNKNKECVLDHKPNFRKYEHLKNEATDLLINICTAIDGHF